eukprot:5337257-Amphidinium_carterae.1
MTSTVYLERAPSRRKSESLSREAYRTTRSGNTCGGSSANAIALNTVRITRKGCLKQPQSLLPIQRQGLPYATAYTSSGYQHVDAYMVWQYLQGTIGTAQHTQKLSAHA